MAKDDFTIEIEGGRIMFMTSYRDEFGEERKVANLIRKERLIEIRDNCNLALEKLSGETPELRKGDISNQRELLLDFMTYVSPEAYATYSKAKLADSYL